jgi:hypothetical protein
MGFILHFIALYQKAGAKTMVEKEKNEFEWSKVYLK